MSEQQFAKIQKKEERFGIILIKNTIPNEESYFIVFSLGLSQKQRSSWTLLRRRHKLIYTETLLTGF